MGLALAFPTLGGSLRPRIGPFSCPACAPLPPIRVRFVAALGREVEVVGPWVLWVAVMGSDVRWTL